MYWNQTQLIIVGPGVCYLSQPSRHWLCKEADRYMHKYDESSWRHTGDDFPVSLAVGDGQMKAIILPIWAIYGYL